MLRKDLLIVFLLLLTSIQCRPTPIYSYKNLHGLWQSLNNKRQVFEFRSDGRVAHYTEGKDIFAELPAWNPIHYKIHKIIDDKRAELILFDAVTKKQFLRLEVHRVNDQRIRLLWLKHNGILDLADEYYKTDGFGNFESIMESFDLKKW